MSSESNKKYFDSPIYEELTGEGGSDGEQRALDPEAVVPHYVKAMIKDVSETGIGIFTDFEFDTEDGIFLDLPTDYGLLDIKATVIRKDELHVRASNARYKYYYGCVFQRTDRRLIKMIYDLQREALKRNKNRG
ncbi:MAG: PilZ domain-containing protein [Lachnospiraceae bacterium]|nr:PilZ domain-containing protein [Lachnospiraceae bacterium]